MTTTNEPHIAIHTDGSCSGNPGPGGYAAILRRLDADGEQTKRIEIGGYELHTTNIRMEMRAVIEAIKRLKASEDQPISISSDNEMVVKGWNEWLPVWIANGWRRSKNKPVINRDLWENMIAAVGDKRVTFHWVRAHVGDPLNEEVDRLAKAQMERAVRALFADAA